MHELDMVDVAHYRTNLRTATKQRGFIPIALIIQFLPYIAVVLVLLGGYMYYKHLVNTIARQDTEIVQLTAHLKENESKLSDCHLANEKYQHAIADINKTVEKLITVSEQQQKTMQGLKGQITKERTEKIKLVTALTDLKKRPLAQSCEAAIQELTDSIKDIIPLAPEQGVAK